MNVIIEKMLDKIKELGWGVIVDGNFITVGKYSPAEMDYSFDVDITDFEKEDSILTAAELFVEAIHSMVDDFDPSYEAYLWLDNTGHGKNGAPYNMRDLYEDMEAIQEMLDDLWTDIYNYYYDVLQYEFEEENINAHCKS